MRRPTGFLAWWLTVVVTMLTVAVLASLQGCQQVPLYRLPTRNRTAWNLPPCQSVPAGIPCQVPVNRTPVSACEKRFGKICNRP